MPEGPEPEKLPYKATAIAAVESLSHLDSNSLIHNTATGQVDVANALRMAEEVSGVVAHNDSTLTETSESFHITSDESTPFDEL